MRYGSTVEATSWSPPDWREKILRSLFFFIPSGNPDYEALFPKIKKWCLELDDTGTVNREIALDGEGLPVFRMPDGSKNVGFWIDEDRTFSPEELEPLSPDEFERLWSLGKSADPVGTDNDRELRSRSCLS